jgi:putative ABC transport system substrate-binding protein
MTTRRQILLAVGSLAAMPALAQDRRVRRIGYLSSRAKPDPLLNEFLEAMRALGYREGVNLSVEERYLEGRIERNAQLAEELAGLNLEVIVTASVASIQALQRATRTAPIVATFMGDPMANGFAKTLARPGGNITGLTQLADELIMKQLEFLRIFVPRLNTVAMLYNPANSSQTVTTAIRAVRAMKLKVVEAAAKTPDELDAAFTLIRRERSTPCWPLQTD